MYSVGIDMIEIERIKKSLKNPNFLHRILGEAEYIQLQGRNIPAQSVAASFAAKEAFAKALGTGIRGFNLNEVMLLREPSGRPYLSFTGNALSIVLEGNLTFSVSITHTKKYAAAVVLATERE